MCRTMVRKHFVMSEVVVQELSDDEGLTGNEVTH
jgi:hypothetical protein